MTFTGKAWQGMLYIDRACIIEDEQARTWIDRCPGFVKTLPDKT